MNEKPEPAVPVWYWAIAIVAVLWNLMGCTFFAMELFAQESMIESYTEEQKEWVRDMPSWIYFVYGLAVTGGVAGSVGLCMRKVWSRALLTISLAAVIVQMVYSMLIAGGLRVMGPSSLIMPAVIIVLGAAFLSFSHFATIKGWLSSTAYNQGK